MLGRTPALSSSPGHAPIHDARCFAEGDVAAAAPTSAMISCAESAVSPITERVYNLGLDEFFAWYCPGALAGLYQGDYGSVALR